MSQSKKGKNKKEVKEMKETEKFQQDQQTSNIKQKQSKLVSLLEKVREYNEKIWLKEMEIQKNGKLMEKQEIKQVDNQAEDKIPQVLFAQQNQLKYEQILEEQIEEKQETSEKQSIPLIEQLEQETINININALVQLRSDTNQYINLSTDQMQEENSNQIKSIQQKVLNLKIVEQKQQQKKKIDESYTGMNIKDNNKELDNQIDEQWEFIYQYSEGKNISVKYFEFIKLNSENYVNDTIINFFLRQFLFMSYQGRFIENELMNKELIDKIFIFNTYFSAKLIPYEKIQSIHQSDFQQFQNLYSQSQSQLIKWTKGDILTKQYLIFPLHLKEHWSLLVVYNPLELCNYLIKDQNEEEQKFVLYFDSLVLFDTKILIMLRLYLLNMYNIKFNKNLDINKIAVKDQNIHQQVIVPRQFNLMDCGVYLLEYAENFLINPDKFINSVQEDKLDIFPRVNIITKRLLIKRLLLNMSKKSKDFAVRLYKSQRQALQDRFGKKRNEYDEIDQENFEWHFKTSQSQNYHLERIRFYLSQDFNFYIEEIN